MITAVVLSFLLAGTGSRPAQPGQLAARVHRAYRYAGHGTLKADTGTQLIAVDLEFSGSTSGLDLDDVELLDGPTREVFDAAPEIAFLNPDGSFFSWHEAPPGGVKRCLLLFQVPVRVKSILLRHWDELLTAGPLKVRPSGPLIPEERAGR